MHELKRVGLGWRRARGALPVLLAFASVSLILPPCSSAAGPTTHFLVTAPATATAGVPFNFTVTAKDATETTDTGYTGTVHFSSTDIAATMPANSMLASGSQTFSATLRTVGTHTISARQVDNPLITGTSGTITVNPATASHFSVSAPSGATVGSAFSFTVTALDPFENRATGYAGTVQFTSSDSGAMLPADSTLTAGTKTFNATMGTEGFQTITATDSVDSSITGTSNAIAVSTATHLAVSAPGAVNANSAFSFTVAALNADGSVDTGYQGTLRFSSSDDNAALPLDSKLTNGRGTFSATLFTPGSQTLKIADSDNPSVAGASGAILVSPSNSFSFGSLKRNTRNGTATLTVSVPGPGNLALGGKGIKPQRPFASRVGVARARTVNAAGKVKLKVSATGRAKRKLDRTGTVKVKAKVTFVPTGGVAARKSISVKLIKHLRG